MRLRYSGRKVIPAFLRDFLRRMVITCTRAANRGRTASDIFSEVYRRNAWGGNPGEFYSGSGSVGVAADAYCEFVTKFIKNNGVKSVVDIGCGDFRIGEKIASSVDSYTGIDIVVDLIERNQLNYGSKSIRFLCADAATDALPVADLCLIRQVFQHLSNNLVKAILEKLAVYRHVLVTEHYPANTAGLLGNVDKSNGPDTRVYDNSAVVLSAPPFNVKSVNLVLQVEAKDFLVKPGETIRTFLFAGESVLNQIQSRETVVEMVK